MKPRKMGKFSKSIPVAVNRFKPLSNLTETIVCDWMESNKKSRNTKGRIQQNAACEDNTFTEINKLHFESFKSKSKDHKFLSTGHREHLLHRRELTCTIPVIINGLIPMNNSDKLTSLEKANTNSAAKNKMHSVVITGDSHARG
jgi:hypothetical protein